MIAIGPQPIEIETLIAHVARPEPVLDSHAARPE